MDAIQDGVPLLYCVQAPLYPCSYIRPAAIFEGDRDNSRSTTVLVVGGFHMFVNLLLSDRYTDE